MIPLLVALFSLILAGTAQASAVDYFFSGVIDGEGTPIRWEAVLNTAVHDRDPADDRADYAGSLLKLQVADGHGAPLYSWPGDAPLTQVGVIQTGNENRYTLTAPVMQANTDYPTAFSLTMYGPRTPLTNAPSLGTIAGGVYEVHWAKSVETFLFHGRVVAVLLPTPIPASVLLFGAGLVVLIGLGWRYRGDTRLRQQTV